MGTRFFVTEPPSPGLFVLSDAEAHHLAHVRRVGVGDEVILFCGDGREFRALVSSIAKREVELDVISVASVSRESAYPVHIASALPKGDRLDFLLEKLTELGVSDFTPLHTERSVVVARESKREKFERAVIEASKQCGRNVLMRIHAPLEFGRWCAQPDLPVNRWLAHPGGEALSVLAEQRDGRAVAIGPEGGFTDEEVRLARDCGFRLLDLGPRILRIETAAAAVAAISNQCVPMPRARL